MQLEVAPGTHPAAVLETWYGEAVAAKDPFPDAMVLATATGSGVPSARVVLYRGMSQNSPRFFTNYESRKGRELAENPNVAAVFHFTSLTRQVRIEGRVERLPDSESDAYFASRARQSQLGAWASAQSRPIATRAVLEAQYAEAEARFQGKPVERPPFWGGYRILASRYEFWLGRTHRLHDRLVYELHDGAWQTSWLSP